jgi:putative membrane protein
MQLLLRLVVNAVSVAITSYILSGVHTEDFVTALIVTVVLGVLNTIIKPILAILTFPITLITLGLFTFVLNALLIMATDYLVPGFTVENFWWALLFSFVLSLISSFLNKLAH